MSLITDGIKSVLGGLLNGPMETIQNGFSNPTDGMGAMGAPVGTGMNQMPNGQAPAGQKKGLLDNPVITNAILKMGSGMLQANASGQSFGGSLAHGFNSFADSLAASEQQQLAQRKLLSEIAGDEEKRKRAMRELELKEEASTRANRNAAVLPDGTVNPAYVEAARARATNVTVNPQVNVGAGETPFRKKRGEGFATALGVLDSEAVTASQAIPRYEAMENAIMNGMETGYAENMLLDARSALESLGVKHEGLDDQQVFNAFVQQNIIPQAKQLGVNPTDRDAKRLEDAGATLGKDEAANLVILKYQKDVANNTVGLQELMAEMELSGANTMQMKKARQEYLKQNSPSVMSLDEARAMIKRAKGGAGAPEGIDPDIWQIMTPEERSLWN